MVGKDTLQEIISRLEQYDKDRIMVRDSLSKKEYTCKMFSQMVNYLANYLLNNNYKEIIAKLDNSYELLLLYFAVIVSGGVIIPVDPEKEEKEITRIKELHSKAIFSTNDIVQQWLKQGDFAECDDFIEYSKLDLGKPFLITYTSGSTGTPKGVIHSAESLLLASYEFGEMMGYDQKLVMGHCMPMTYMAGILNTIIMPFVFGGIVVILPRFSIKTVLGYIPEFKNNRINAIWLSPTMLRMIYIIDRRAELKEYFHSVGMKISVGTAPLDIVLRKDFEDKYDMHIYQSYGLSETLFISTEVPGDKAVYHTVGRILDGIDLEILKDGEIGIKAPWLLKGYVANCIDKVLKDNFYLTGDLGKIIGDKYLLITGRKKELIVKGGYNINPRDIENLLTENGIAEECAVISVDIHGEEGIALCYVPKKKISLQEINTVVCLEIGKHSRIDIVDIVSALPKNLNGKIDKIKLKKDIGDRWL